ALRAAIRGGSKSFYAAGQLLPAGYRDAAFALYGFCRSSDDAADAPGAGAAAIAALSDRLDAVYAGAPRDSAADRAFAALIDACAIPKALPFALIDGMGWDVAGRRYATIGDLEAYAARVAGAVGAMMALIMGARDRATLSRAVDLGLAMQLTNIARDVGEDAAMGRLYLPEAWLREEGVDPDAFLADPGFSPGVGRTTLRLLAQAERYYDRASAGISQLPWRCRPAMQAARMIYRDIGRIVADRGGDGVTRRAVASKRRKLRRAAEAAAVAYVPAVLTRGATAPAARYLVDAARPAITSDDGVVARAIDVFERLERRDRGLIA
ncbi:MAG: phytoene/squalene synthase family protein, partial [Pseudomonadota bacterium]